MPQVALHDRIDRVGCEQWSAVVESADAPAFYDYRFLRAYERAPLQPTREFLYLTFSARPGGPVEAVLPAYVQGTDDPAGDVSGLGLPDRSGEDLILLTHVIHCYDTGLPARAPLQGLAERACEALADLAGHAGVKWFAFLDVDGSSALACDLAAIGLARIPMDTRFRRDIAAYASAEEFVASLPSRSARRGLRYTHYRARRIGMDVIVRDPSPAGGEAAEAVELCRLTTARHGTAAYYPEELHEFVALAGELTRVVEVRLRGRLATAAICLLDGTRLHLWAGGLDYEVAEEVHSAFPLLFQSALEQAIATGRPILEAGRANAETKRWLRLEPIPLYAFVGRP